MSPDTLDVLSDLPPIAGRPTAAATVQPFVTRPCLMNRQKTGDSRRAVGKHCGVTQDLFGGPLLRQLEPTDKLAAPDRRNQGSLAFAGSTQIGARRAGPHQPCPGPGVTTWRRCHGLKGERARFNGRTRASVPNSLMLIAVHPNPRPARSSRFAGIADGSVRDVRV